MLTALITGGGRGGAIVNISTTGTKLPIADGR